MPKPHIRNFIESSIPSGIIPDIRGNQQKINENQQLLTVASILPFHGHFFIDETAFNTRDQALVWANKLTDGVIHGASYRTKDAKPKGITHYKAIALNFQNKTKFLEATSLHGRLPAGYVLPNGKGEAFLTWILDREYSAEELAPALEKLKSIAARHGVTLTAKIPWTKVCKQVEWVPEITLSDIEKALVMLQGSKPANMALEAPEILVETRNDSGDASVGVEEIDAYEERNKESEEMEVVEGTYEQCAEVVGLEEMVMEEMEQQDQEMPDTKAEADNDTLRFMRTITPTGELIHVRSFGKKSGVGARPDYKFFSDPSDAALHAQALGEKKWDVYLATASFKDASSAEGVNFRSACSCPIDFDVDANVDAKHYGSKTDALAGMQRVKEKLFGDMEASPLVIVDSGNGIQAHVILSESVDVAVRKRLGTKIEKACIALGEKPDTAVTKDAVRIMRVPGTFNYKGFKGGVVKPVSCLEWNSGKVAPSELESRLDELLGVNGELASAIGVVGAGGGAEDPVMKNLLGNDEPFVLAQNQNAIASLLEALNPDDEDHWRWALKLYKGCKQFAEATEDELKALWKQLMEWSRQSPAFESEEQQWTKMEEQGLCHPRGVYKHFQEPVEKGGIGWKNPGTDVGVDSKDPNFAWVHEFNEKYTPVLYNTKMAVAFREEDEAMSRQKWTFLPFNVFKELHCSEYAVVSYDKKGLPITGKKGQGWLGHPLRIKNHNFYFNPEQPPALDRDGYLNLWMGLNVSGDASKGDPMPMVRHIKEVIASEDPELGQYVMGWVALLIQKPWYRHEVALVLRGSKGSGKGTLGNLLCQIFGKHGIAVRHSRHLTGNFNEHLLDCCFLFADEAFFAGDRAGEASLKGMITEPTSTIEPKGIGAFQVPNRLSILMATNSDYVVPATTDERRYAILDVSDAKKGELAYWNMFHMDWMSNPDNIAAFVEYMRDYDLSGYNPRVYPKTRALAEQVEFSFEPWEAWWHDALSKGSFFRNGIWYEVIGSQALRDSLLNYCHEQGVDRYGRVTDDALSKKLKKLKLCSGSLDRRIKEGEEVPARVERDGAVTHFLSTTITNKNPKCRNIGTLEEAREAFRAAFTLLKDTFEFEEAA